MHIETYKRWFEMWKKGWQTYKTNLEGIWWQRKNRDTNLAKYVLATILEKIRESENIVSLDTLYVNYSKIDGKNLYADLWDRIYETEDEQYPELAWLGKLHTFEDTAYYIRFHEIIGEGDQFKELYNYTEPINL